MWPQVQLMAVVCFSFILPLLRRCFPALACSAKERTVSHRVCLSRQTLASIQRGNTHAPLLANDRCTALLGEGYLRCSSSRPLRSATRPPEVLHSGPRPTFSGSGSCIDALRGAGARHTGHHHQDSTAAPRGRSRACAGRSLAAAHPGGPAVGGAGAPAAALRAPRDLDRSVQAQRRPFAAIVCVEGLGSSRRAAVTMHVCAAYCVSMHQCMALWAWAQHRRQGEGGEGCMVCAGLHASPGRTNACPPLGYAEWRAVWAQRGGSPMPPSRARPAAGFRSAPVSSAACENVAAPPPLGHVQHSLLMRTSNHPSSPIISPRDPGGHVQALQLSWVVRVCASYHHRTSSSCTPPSPASVSPFSPSPPCSKPLPTLAPGTC